MPHKKKFFFSFLESSENLDSDSCLEFCHWYPNWRKISNILIVYYLLQLLILLYVCTLIGATLTWFGAFCCFVLFDSYIPPVGSCFSMVIMIFWCLTAIIGDILVILLGNMNFYQIPPVGWAFQRFFHVVNCNLILFEHNLRKFSCDRLLSPVWSRFHHDFITVHRLRPICNLVLQPGFVTRFCEPFKFRLHSELSSNWVHLTWNFSKLVVFTCI